MLFAYFEWIQCKIERFYVYTNKHRTRATPSKKAFTKRSLLIYVLLLVISISSVWVLNLIEGAVKADIEKSLQLSLRSAHENLNAQYENYKNAVQLWADNPEIKSMVKDLSTQPTQPESLISARSQRTLRARLNPRFITTEYQGFFVIGKDNINLASSRNLNVGNVNLLTQQEGFLEKIWAGETRVSLPLSSDVALADIHGNLVKNPSTMFVASPIKNTQGQVIAILMLRLDPKVVFGSVFGHARFGTSGEIYAFNKAGLLLSESRFDDQLQAMRLLKGRHSEHNISIRDPGVNMTLGLTPSLKRDIQPFTYMVQMETSVGNGSNIDGYRDYRGVPAVGVWV